jgi:hypothetical protein
MEVTRALRDPVLFTWVVVHTGCRIILYKQWTFFVVLYINKYTGWYKYWWIALGALQCAQ